MTSILVSSDDPGIHDLIGEKVAKSLGYKYLGRSFLAQVAARYNVKEERLVRVLDRMANRLTSKSHNLLLAYIQTAALEELLNDNVVCGGLAAHLYVRDVSHVLMVRVLADAQARVHDLVDGERISKRKALRQIAKDRERRERWSMDSFGINECDPSIYDMVISLGQIEVKKVVEIVKDMAGYRKFQSMTYSRKMLANLALAGRVRVELLPKFPDIRVRADGDTAIVHVKCSKRQKQKISSEIKQIAGKIPGVKLLEVHAASSLRSVEEEERQAVVNGE